MRSTITELLELNGKPVFSGHETFALRYGWMKKVYSALSEIEGTEKTARDVFNSDDAIAVFGVGKNMVSSMRHWATWTSIIDDNGQIDSFAKSVLSDDGLDPWMESPISLWLLHWQLASKPRLLTYYWFFNYYNGGVFDREKLKTSIVSMCEDHSIKAPPLNTIKRDIDCFLGTYVSKPNKKTGVSEDSLESPLAELNLITPVNKRDIFQPRRGSKNSLTIGLFLLVLWDFWNKEWAKQTTLSLEASVYDACSPGRIFLLDEDAVLEKAYKLAEMDVGIEWSESSGMRQFQRTISLDDIKKTAMKLIEEEYTGA